MTASQFLKAYEQATNSHEFAQVQPFLASDACYFFSDATLHGIAEVKQSFLQTWDTIQNEQYHIDNVEWLARQEDLAAYVYTFHWKGVVAGTTKEGHGRGTNIMQKQGDDWKMIHEHLSKVPQA